MEAALAMGLEGDSCGGTNPDASVALKISARFSSPQWDQVVPPTHLYVCSGLRPLGRSVAEKRVVLSRGTEDRREDRCSSG